MLQTNQNPSTAQAYNGFSKVPYFPDEFWARRTPMGARDVVRIAEAELVSGSERLLVRSADRWQYITSPALPFFTLHLNKIPDDDDAELKFDFEPLPRPLPDEVGIDGVVSTSSLVCRMAFKWSKVPDWIPVIGMVFGVASNRATGSREPSVKFEWLREGKVDSDVIEFVEKHMRWALSYYLRVQALMLNRPEIFRRTTVSCAPNDNANPHKKRREKARKEKAYRVITLNREEREAPPPTGIAHTITCPCWGVIGHWRQYKSGKRVWIRPHKKGKARNTSGAYSSKEYEIMRGGDHD
jgi:hypothetical protein